MWTTLAVFFNVLWTSLTPGQNRRWPSLRRAISVIVLAPVFLIWWGITALMHCLDRLIFPAYRDVSITRPVFIVGVPRSGTTHLHTVMSNHPEFTSLTLWECLFAPSITQRWLVHQIATVDRAVGRPLHRAVAWVSRRVFAGLQGVHPTGLNAPEEDYLTLLPNLACLVLVAVFPGANSLWQLGDFTSLSAARQRHLLDRYDANLRKHLYWHGQQKRLLSKNAAFASWSAALSQRYPDATFIVCLRDPCQALASQLTALEPAITALDSRSQFDDFSGRFTALYARWLHTLLVTLPALSSRIALVNQPALQHDFLAVIERIEQVASIPHDASFQAHCEAEALRNQHYKARTLKPLHPLPNEFDSLYAQHDFNDTTVKAA